MTLQGVGRRPSPAMWRAPAIALGLTAIALIIIAALGFSVAGGLSAGLVLTFPLGMAAAVIVASGQTRQYGIPIPFVVALSAVIAIGFAFLDLALAAAVSSVVSSATTTAARDAANNQRTAFVLLGLLLFAVSATVVSALASRRGAVSREIVTTQLVLALMCLPVLNLVGAAIWFSLRFRGLALPEAADEFLPPKEPKKK